MSKKKYGNPLNLSLDSLLGVLVVVRIAKKIKQPPAFGKEFRFDRQIEKREGETQREKKNTENNFALAGISFTQNTDTRVSRH